MVIFYTEWKNTVRWNSLVSNGAGEYASLYQFFFLICTFTTKYYFETMSWSFLGNSFMRATIPFTWAQVSRCAPRSCFKHVTKSLFALFVFIGIRSQENSHRQNLTFKVALWDVACRFQPHWRFRSCVFAVPNISFFRKPGHPSFQKSTIWNGTFIFFALLAAIRSIWTWKGIGVTYDTKVSLGSCHSDCG